MRGSLLSSLGLDFTVYIRGTAKKFIFIPKTCCSLRANHLPFTPFCGPTAQKEDRLSRETVYPLYAAQKEFPGIVSFCLAAIMLFVCSMLKQQRSVVTGIVK